MNKTQTIVWATAGVSLIAFIYLVSGILLPFFAGLLIAYAMSPGLRNLEKIGIGRSFGAIIMLSSVFLSIVLLLFIAIPFMQTELFHLASCIPQYGNNFMAMVQFFLEKGTSYILQSDFAHLKELASPHIGELLTWTIRLFARILTNSLAIANLLSLMVITPIVAFYCLRDWEKIISTLDRWLPRPYAPTLRRLFQEINTTLGAFAKGQSLVCLTIGLYYSIALTCVGLDFSLIVGPLIGLVAFIPYVGALLGCMLSLGIALAQFSDWLSIGLVTGIFFIGQILEGYLLIPYFVGDRIGLHPIWVIFALLTGGVLYGFWGILFALPVAAALGVLLRHLLQIYLKSPYYLGKRASPHKKLS